MAKTLGDITGELTQKVLVPAKAEAEQFLKDARAEAAKIVSTAQAEADKIRQQMKRDVENLKKQMEVDLETASRNFLILVEERLERAVVDPVIEEAVKPLLNDPHFLEKMIMEILTGYAQRGGKEHHIEILLPQAKKDELEIWFTEIFRHKVAQRLDVRFTDKISFGFKIGVVGEGSHINFSEGLIQVFSEFCSPRFRKYFFRGKES
jgi:V/A-type H+-transporting ATPase subunit E